MSKDETGRREFLQRGLRSMLRSLADRTDRDQGADEAIQRSVLRPPGAVPEREFLDTCYRCGMCVEVCPAQAIRQLPTEDEALVNTPLIDPDLAACTACETIACAKNCPSKALVMPASVRDIRIGLAQWYPRSCVRDAGEECRACVDACPVGTDAIRVADVGAIVVNADGCIGCGMCQQACPTRPRAIQVRPLNPLDERPR
jgi:MauM/NapG family ferredoxin protein